MRSQIQDLRSGIRFGFSVAGCLIDGPDQIGDRLTIDHVGDVRRDINRGRKAGARGMQVAEVRDERRDYRLQEGGRSRAHDGTNRELGVQVGSGDQQVEPAVSIGDVDVHADAERQIGRDTGIAGRQHLLQPADQFALVHARARIDRPLGGTQAQGRDGGEEHGGQGHGRSNRHHA